MWKERSSSILPLLHMGFGVGALIAPVVCSPFLATIANIKEGTETGKKYDVIKKSLVEQAYLVIGLFTLFASVPFYIFQCRASTRANDYDDGETLPLKPKKSKTLKEILNPGTYADGDFWFGLSMLAILFIYYFNLLGGEKAIASFVRTMSVDAYSFGKDGASLMHTGFWLSLTIGRLTSALVARYFSIKTLFTFQVVLHMCSILFLYQYGLSGVRSFMFFILVEGFFVAPLYPQGVAYGNTQMDITGVSLMVIVFAGSFGDVVYLWAAGWMYDNYGAQALFSLSTFAAATLVICVIMFRKVAGKKKKTFPSAIPNFEPVKSASIFRRVLGIFVR